MSDFEDLVRRLRVSPVDPYPGSKDVMELMSEAADAIETLVGEADQHEAALTVIANLREWVNTHEGIAVSIIRDKLKDGGF